MAGARRTAVGAFIYALFLSCLTFSTADAQASFYKGKQIDFIVGSDVGGGYDAYARLVARYIGKYIPGRPAVIVQNMPGAGSLNMMNFVYNVSPQDGTVLGAAQNGAPFEPLFHLLSANGKTARFDARKINWIGSPATEDFVPLVWNTSKIRDFSDLQKYPVRFGANEANTDNGILATLLNKMFQTKITVVAGYPGSTHSIFLAMERGEVDGLAGMSYATLAATSPQLLAEHKIRLLAQIGMEKDPNLPDVPLVLDLAPTDQDRSILRAIFAKYEMARPIFVAPGVPSARVAILRTAFDAAMSDPDLRRDAGKQRLEIDPVRGSAIQTLVDQIYGLPEPLVSKVRQTIGYGKE